MPMRMLAPGYRMTSDMIRNKAPVELSDGEAMMCLPTLSRGASAQSLGTAVLQSDPAVEYAATEVGFSPKPDMLRAPDVAVLPGPPKDGWLKEAPPLAVEYADRGQDKADLKKKIREYLENGVKLVWVVRMDVPRHVEVYTPDGKKEIFGPGTTLLAPGILANPVPVEALYEPGAARETVLRNSLARAGYSGLEEVFEEGKAEGKAEGIAEGKAEGIAEGKAEGIAEGKAEGIAEGKEVGAALAMRATLVSVYTARFGAIPPELQDALGPQSAAALSRWVSLFATGSAEEIRQRICAAPPV